MTSRLISGRRVAVWGYGREGRSALRFLLTQHPSEVAVVTDDPLSAAEVQEIADTRPGTRSFAGNLGVKYLQGMDVVVRSPGISVHRPEVQRLLQGGVKITSGTDLWLAEHLHDRVVAVTGTKGKSTTTLLVAHLLQSCGLSVVAAGNIGVPLLDIFRPAVSPDVYVVEVSSFQAADLQHSPRYGVLLNLFPEHRDWHGSLDAYYAEKINLFRHRPDVDLVANFAVEAVRNQLRTFRAVHWYGHERAYHASTNKLWYEGRVLCSSEQLPISGRHNLDNLCGALTVCRVLGLTVADPAEALRGFEPLSHRLEDVGTYEGVTYVDDSIATIPEATCAALETFRGRPITLLIGGQSRGQDYSHLARLVARRTDVLAVLGMHDTGPAAVAAVQAEADQTGARVRCEVVDDLEDAVRVASRLTPAGGVVLLSPGAPSYGRYRNFEERGDAFRNAAARIHISESE